MTTARFSERAIQPIHVTLKGQGVDIEPALVEFASRRVQSALGRFSARVRSVDAVLEDLNGPRGGVDKRCRLDIRLEPRGRISVAARAESRHSAIAEAALHARRMLVDRSKRRLVIRQGLRRAEGARTIAA